MGVFTFMILTTSQDDLITLQNVFVKLLKIVIVPIDTALNVYRGMDVRMLCLSPAGAKEH